MPFHDTWLVAIKPLCGAANTGWVFAHDKQGAFNSVALLFIVNWLLKLISRSCKKVHTLKLIHGSRETENFYKNGLEWHKN